MKRTGTCIFAAVGIGAVILFSCGCEKAQPRADIERSTPTISVRGTGKVEAEPDEAIVRFGVVSDEKTLEKAYSDNTRKMNAVIEAAVGEGVGTGDIKTSSYSVVPVYPRDDSGRQLPGKPVSFRVSQEITLRIRDLPRTGGIIDKVVSSGANTLSGIQFTSGRLDELGTRAKIKAARDAKDKAGIIAGALDVKLGRVLRVDQSPDRPYPEGRVMAYDMAALRSAPRIEAGTMEVTAVCDVVYEIIQD